MTKKQGKSGTIDVKAVVAEDEGFVRALVRAAVQEVLEAEMTEAVGRREGRALGGAARLPVGVLRPDADHAGRQARITGAAGPDGAVFDRAVRTLSAVGAGAGGGAGGDVRARGLDPQKPALAKAGVKAITEELCGHSFSASSISAMNQRLDASLAHFAGRPLAEAFPYLILDARYERVREAGVIVSPAVLIAIGIDWDGRRQVLAVELANRESRSSWRDFLLALKARGLHGVEFVVADDHAGLRAALREALAEAAYQRCYVHFLRNALDYIDETLTFYRLPRQHHQHLKSTNRLERLNEEIKRRTQVVRIFPNGESCLRLVRALAVETHENWLEQHRYLNMEDLREHKKEACAVPPEPRPVQPSTVLALSRTLRAGSAGAAAGAAASLTAAARGALPGGRSGRRDGRFPIEQRDVALGMKSIGARSP